MKLLCFILKGITMSNYEIIIKVDIQKTEASTSDSDHV